MRDPFSLNRFAVFVTMSGSKSAAFDFCACMRGLGQKCFGMGVGVMPAHLEAARVRREPKSDWNNRLAYTSLHCIVLGSSKRHSANRTKRSV